MFYILMSDGTFTGYKSRSFNKAVKMCNDYRLPADIRELDQSKSRYLPVIYSNLSKCENIYLKRGK